MTGFARPLTRQPAFILTDQARSGLGASRFNQARRDDRMKTMATTRDIVCPTCNAPAGKMCVSAKSGKPLSDIHRDRRPISLRQAARMGIERLRKPIWSNALDHVKIDIIGGELGPWVHLFAPFNQECNGRDPVDMLWALQGGADAEELVPYTGPLPDSDEYRAAVKRFEGVLAE